MASDSPAQTSIFSMICDKKRQTCSRRSDRKPGPAPARQVRASDPFFQRWSREDTQTFFEYLEAHGADFSLYGNLLERLGGPRLKNKFKKERKLRASKVDEALRKHQEGINAGGTKCLCGQGDTDDERVH